MARLELLRSQKNEVFRMIKEAELDPTEFIWSESDSALSGDFVRLTHEPTHYFFDFGTFKLKWLCRHFPTPDKAAVTSFSGWDSWSEILGQFRRWVSIVRREIGEPDLWDISQEEKKLIAEDIEDLDNLPFADFEKVRISTAIAEIREFLTTSSQHSESQIQFITSRLQHLEDASKRLGRKDWITLAAGTLTNIVVGVALAPESARELFRVAGSLLGWIVGSVQLLP